MHQGKCKFCQIRWVWLSDNIYIGKVTCPLCDRPLQITYALVRIPTHDLLLAQQIIRENDSPACDMDQEIPCQARAARRYDTLGEPGARPTRCEYHHHMTLAYYQEQGEAAPESHLIAEEPPFAEMRRTAQRKVHQLADQEKHLFGSKRGPS